jgi:3-phosphoshikimate 1-carboxyvinyltransferase
MQQEFNQLDKVKGELNLPGDKSISHRAVIFSSMAKGISLIKNLSDGEDVKSTKECFRKLGAEINRGKGVVKINGRGFKGFKKSTTPLNAGNSGTTARLLSGLLAVQDFESVIIGDEYLSLRPMKRIIDPLKEMGCKIKASERNTLPLIISPSKKIIPINYNLPVASAQVKSAVLLAGLHLDEPTCVIEKFPTRDHTERMLGLKTGIKNNNKVIYSSKEYYPEINEYIIPSDISTAAFFIVLALLVEKSELKIKNVSLNETRTGILNILSEMGGKIEIDNKQENAGEPFGDVIIKNSSLKNIKIHEEYIPNIIDEIPVLSVAGLFAEGKFKIRNAGELRGKETDRIKALCSNYKLLGLNVEESADGFCISGEIKNKSVSLFDSFGDHRIAMTFSILSLLLKQGGKVNNFDCVKISNPYFIDQLKIITG